MNTSTTYYHGVILIHGHANDRVVEALKSVAERGTSFGAPTEIENKLAKLVIERAIN